MTKPAMSVEEEWREYLLGRHPGILTGRRMFGWMPSEPRCRLCHSPFQGIGALIAGPMGMRPWEKNPNLCRRCVRTMAPKGAHGADIELSFLFADVRGSTTIAEDISAEVFSSLMNRFYAAASTVLIEHDALVDKYVGDEVIGLFIPGIAGERHAARAIDAGRRILEETGHRDAAGPWLPVGVGVHTGVARVGLVGSPGGVMDFTALGDSVNTAARLATEAAAGEVLVSAPAAAAASLGADGTRERRELQLKGRRESVSVEVLRVEPEVAALAQ